MPAIDECPDGVFIEDTMVVYGDLAVIARSGADSAGRRLPPRRRRSRGQGYRITRITEPGTLDGGDILKIGSTVYAGLGGRTNDEGIRQLRDALAPLGADVRAVPVRKVLHLKSAVTALPDGTVIGYEPLVDDQAAFDSFRPVPEEAGAHIVLLGEGRLLMAASAPKTADAVRGARLHAGRRGHQRVREARGLCHVLVGAPSALSNGRAASAACRSRFLPRALATSHASTSAVR